MISTKQIKMAKLTDTGYSLRLYQEKDEEELAYILQVESENDQIKIHLCDTYSLDTANLLFILLKEQLANYADLSKALNDGQGGFILKGRIK